MITNIGRFTLCLGTQNESGHKTLESVSNYIHPTDEGRIVSMQALDNADGILTAQGIVESVRGVESVEKRARKPLQDKQVAVPG